MIILFFFLALFFLAFDVSPSGIKGSATSLPAPCGICSKRPSAASGFVSLLEEFVDNY